MPCKIHWNWIPPICKWLKDIFSRSKKTMYLYTKLNSSGPVHARCSIVRIYLVDIYLDHKFIFYKYIKYLRTKPKRIWQTVREVNWIRYKITINHTILVSSFYNNVYMADWYMVTVFLFIFWVVSEIIIPIV